MARNDGIDRTFARNQDLPTLDDVAKVQEHNEREKDSYSNQDIDTTQTYRNIHFKAPTDSYAAMFDQLIADGVISTRGLKADAVKYGELIFDVNSAYFHNHGGYEYAKWNSQENRTPMSKTLSGKRVISEASPFDQWREIQFIGSVAPAAVVVGLDPAEYDLANLIPLHGGAVEPVDQFLLQRCEKTLHARVVKAAMRAAHALPDGTEPGEHRPVLLAGVLAAVVGVQYQPLLITIA